MMMGKLPNLLTRISLLTMLVLTLCNSARAEDSVCQILAKSVYTYLDIKRSGSLNEDVYEYLTTATSNDQDRKSKFSGSATIPIQGVPIKFGADMSDGEKTGFNQSLTSQTSRRLSDTQLYTVLAAIPNPEIAEKALQCAILAEAGGLFLALTSEDKQFVHIKGSFKKRCSCEDDPKILRKDGVVIIPEPTRQVNTGGLKGGGTISETFAVDIPRPADGGAVTLTINAPPYAQSITVPKHKDPPNYIQLLKEGKIFFLTVRQDYPASSALRVNETYEIAYIQATDKWRVQGRTLYADENRVKLRVCEHSNNKDFKDGLGVIRPVVIENNEFGIWGGIVRFSESLQISDVGKFYPKPGNVPMPEIPNAKNAGECRVEP